MRKDSIILIMMLILVVSVFATMPGPQYPLYAGLNELAPIIAGSKAIGIENVSITFKGETSYLAYVPELDRYRTYLSSDVEEDVQFTVRGYANESPFVDLENYDVLNDDEIIADNLIRAFKYNHTTSHNETDPGSAVICTTIDSKQGTPEIYFVSGYENGSQIVWHKNPVVHVITESNYQTYCHESTTYFVDNFSNDYFYYGFYCDNCGLTTKLNLNVENDDLLSNSVYFDDLNDNTTTDENTINFGIAASISHNEPIQYSEEIIYFREPYNVTINLYKENSTTPGQSAQYCNEFSNIYMLQYESESDSDSLGAVADGLNSFFFLFDPLNIREFIGTTTINTVDDKVYYNGIYKDCSATITLYEPGNYSVYLVGSKYVIQDKDYGFISPVTGNEQFVSKILGDQALVFDVKENVNIDIFTSDWEISKIWVLLNVGKWLLITVVPLLLIFLFKSGILLALVKK